MNRRQYRDFVESLIDSYIAKSTGPIDTDRQEDDIATRVCTAIAEGGSGLDVIHLLTREYVRSSVSRRRIERHDDSQDLFPDTMLEALVGIDKSTVIKCRNASGAVMQAAQQRREDNLKRQTASYERWCERMEKLREAGLFDDPAMTVGDAVLRLTGKKSAA